ncbi:porin family protein [Winogradskyella bathintestinalis]|uniref:TonB-dependent receptor n=1 Tax=Winogradskyella bathintestinalis TaxID=3035208 RepID=A0ABT7ZYM1_9FLAO|nr:TonB-dependent receptor [Winogradskyella bathintestinalis]MDN3494100.1 TonB-dependent receptor [Winogradskyella bathintestinalis]
MKTKYIILSLLTLSLAFGNAQEKDTIADQTVNVIKPYTPTISDAFKIKDNPTLSDSNSVKKKDIKYNIFSIPVASTFTPAKGKAATVDKAKAVKLYDNYASLGFGSYTTILGEVYLNHELSRDENVGGYFSHHSSQGGIDDLLLDDNFSKTKLNAYYKKSDRDFTWQIDGGFNLQTYNWYGVSQDFYLESDLDGVDAGQIYNDLYVDGKIDFEDAIVKDASLRFRRFGDSHDSAENRLVAKTGFDFPVQDEVINAELSVDYISGYFEGDLVTTAEIDYGNITLGFAPSFQMTRDDLTLDLGVKLVYLNDTEFSESKFLIYPNIEASYRLVDELLIAYGGLKGDLIQNSYYDFANENPFVSPSLFITPTDQQYKIFVGVKGKLTNNVGYNLTANYASEKNKALYKSNPASNAPLSVYQYGNSFNVTYDDVTTFSVAGELNVDFNRNFTLGVKGEFFAYNTDNQAEAWNLPDLTASLFLDYQISEQWFAGSSLFFVGERKDQRRFVDELNALNNTVATVSLDSYFDINAHVGYKVNDQLSIFGKANNIASQNYERWLNFPVQGIQVLAGATYQFDF